MQNWKLIQKIVVMLKQNTQKTWGDTGNYSILHQVFGDVFLACSTTLLCSSKLVYI